MPTETPARDLQQLNVRVEQDLYWDLRRVAVEKRTTPADLVRTILRDFLGLQVREKLE